MISFYCGEIKVTSSCVLDVAVTCTVSTAYPVLTVGGVFCYSQDCAAQDLLYCWSRGYSCCHWSPHIWDCHDQEGQHWRKWRRHERLRGGAVPPRVLLTLQTMQGHISAAYLFVVSYFVNINVPMQVTLCQCMCVYRRFRHPWFKSRFAYF